MTTPTLKVLQAARDLLADPEKWTQGEVGRNTKGIPVEANDPEAVCFCSIGAVDRATFELDKTGEAPMGTSRACTMLVKALEIVENSGYVSIAEYNDTHTHAEVLTLFDKAIELEKKEQP